MSNLHTPQAVVCVANEGNEISLQLWKIYKPLRDLDAESEGLIRVIDESRLGPADFHANTGARRAA